MKETSIKKNFILSTLYQILTLVTPLITAPYISRVLGADGIGIYSYSYSVVSYFLIFAALGTASYGAREIARNRKDEQVRSKLFWEIEILTIITSCISLLIWLILTAFTKDYKLYFLILSLNLISTMLDISWFYTGLEQMKYTVRQNSIFKILGVIALLVFIKDSNDVAKYTLIMTLTTLLGTASMWIYLPKFLVKINFKKIKIKIHIKETLIYFIPTIARSMYTMLDKTLIGLITKENSQNGYYEQATKIINMCKSVTFMSLNSVLGARISYLYAEKKFEEIKTRISTSIDYILFMGIGIFFGLIGVSDRFVPMFFGNGYDEVIILLKCLSPIIIIIGISNCLGSQYYTPSGRRKQSAKYIIYGACVNLIFNLILIPRFKSFGAVVATIIAEFLITILYIKNSENIVTFKMLFNKGWKKIISGAIMLVFIILIDLFCKNNIIAIIIEVVIGLLVYMAILTIMKDSFIMDFCKKQINNIKNRLKERI